MMTSDRIFHPATILIAIALLFAGQIVIRLGSELNHDTAWYLYVAQGLRGGGELYRDYVEVNPPLAMWLTVPVVMLSGAAGLSPAVTLKGVFFAITAASLLLTWRYLNMFGGLPKWTARIILLLLAAALLFIPGFSFGQREHLLALLFMPWFMLRVARSHGAQVSIAEAAFIGVLGAVAICLKPHAILAPLALEAMLLRHRSFRTMFAPENLAAGVFAAFYAVAIMIWCPLFLSEMLHLGVAAYVPYYGFDAANIIVAGARPALVMVLGLILIYLAKGPMRELASLAFAAAVGFLAAFFLQSKGFYYQLIPAQVFAAASGIFALAGILDSQNHGEARRSPVVPAIAAFAIAMLSFSSQVYFYRGAQFSPYLRDAKSVFIASTNLYNGFPLVVRENLVWGSRFPALWLTPYVAERWQDGPLPDDPIIAFALEALVTDLQNFHPDVVIINQSPAQEYIKGGTFDYLKFMDLDPRFKAIWSSYELRGQAGKFAVYAAKSP